MSAVTVTLLAASRWFTGPSRRLLDSDLARWSRQTGLTLGPGGLTGRWRGAATMVSEEPPGWALIRCDTDVEVASLELFVNARLVPLGFTFIRPDAPGAARWALARREHLPLLSAWLADEALFADLASFLQGRRARLRGRWLELEQPGRPADITPLLDKVASLAVRLRAAWWAPREALAERWALRFDRDPGWQLHGRLGGCPLWLSFNESGGRLALSLPHAPPGLQVARRGEGPADVIGNPLLDHLLSIRCPGPRTFLQGPELSAALLAVVHGLPHATLRAGTLTIEQVLDEPEHVDDVLARLSDLAAAWPSDTA